MSLEQKIEGLVKSHRELYAENREYEMPWACYFLFGETDEVVGVAPLIGNRDMWKIVRDFLTQSTEELGIHAFLHVSEGYSNSNMTDQVKEMKRDEDGLPIGGGSLRDKPDSQEVLIITGGNRTGRRFTGIWRIKRDAESADDVLEKVMYEFNDAEDAKAKSISRWDLWDRPSLRGTVH